MKSFRSSGLSTMAVAFAIAPTHPSNPPILNPPPKVLLIADNAASTTPFQIAPRNQTATSTGDQPKPVPESQKLPSNSRPIADKMPPPASTAGSSGTPLDNARPVSSSGDLQDISHAIEALSAKIDEKLKKPGTGFWDWLEDIKIADSAMIIFTLLLVIVGFRQVNLGRRQEKILDNQTTIMGNQEKIMRSAETFTEQATEVSRLAAVSLARAYIYHDSLTLSRSVSGTHHRLVAQLKLKNFGSTPAIAKVISIWWSKIFAGNSTPPIPGRDPQLEGLALSDVVIGPEEPIETTFQMEEALTSAAISRIQSGTDKLFLIIHVEYKDIFGYERRTSITTQVGRDIRHFSAVDGAPYNVRT